jgi:L-asparaginase
MNTRKSSILLLYCGGTIGMRQDIRTSALRPSLTAEDLLTYEKQLSEEFDITAKTITNMDSTNMQPHHWSTIAAAIAKDYEHYDGFVVTHGTDTMAYTATALSLALENLGKPVVLTGSQIPPEMLGSDALNNLVHACQVATMDFAEVCIVFGTKILRGNRSMKVSESERNAFISPVFPELGSIRLQPELTLPNVQRRHSGTLKLRNHFKGDIAVLKCVPGLTSEIVNSIINAGIDGLILETFGPGNIPTNEVSLLPSIRLARKKKIPVLISTQCIYGTTRMYLYEVGQQALKLNVIPTRDMTPETAFVKLKWALGQTKDPEKVLEIMENSVAGEMSMRS